MFILSWLFRSRLDRPGVYRIRNRKNSKVYIGSTQRTIRVRLDEHVWRLSTGTHPNSTFQRDWNTYGRRAFTFKVLENAEPSQVEMRELDWQLRTPRELLYARIVQPTELRQQRAVWLQQSLDELLDRLIGYGWTDEDFQRLFKAHVAARAISRRR